MSYLSSGAGLPNLTKAVISLWFRVPQASITVASAAQGYDPETMIGGALIPLLTFGGVTGGFNSGVVPSTYSGSLTAHTGTLVDGAFEEDYPAVTQTGFASAMGEAEVSSPVQLPPSTIAVDCSGDAPCVYVNLQTPNCAHRTGESSYLSNGTYSSDVYAITAAIDSPPTDPPPDFMRREDWIAIGADFTDVILSGRPETFLGRSNVPITADAWHHLLLSFDLSGTIGNGASGCQMWMALDDINCIGEGLPSLTVLGSGQNTIFPASTMSTSPDAPPIPPQSHPSGWYPAGQTDTDPPIPTYTWIDTTITGSFEPITYRFKPEPLVGGPLNVPAPGSAVRQVQMAELQIFTGVALDTSVEANRRAFINSKGQPVDEAYGVAKYRGIYGPASPNVTPVAPVKLLGGLPDISLTRKASNWGVGVSLGASRAKFATTGKIKAVKPDPVVGK